MPVDGMAGGGGGGLAAAVDAATEGMLAAFGHWPEEDEEVGGAIGGGAAVHAGIQHHFHMVAQHTATAASSLSALPSAGFFSGLRVGDGVDALDLIGYPQWRHAIILDSRHDDQEFFIRWAGWDSKWDEKWVHCLRLAPAHSKVIGDTGPEDSAEKTLAQVIGKEWATFTQQQQKQHHTQAKPLADIQIKIEGVAPWVIIEQKANAADSTSSAIDEEKYQSSLSSSSSLTPPRHSVSATPPYSSYGSLDPDDDDADIDHTGAFSLTPGLHSSPNGARQTTRYVSNSNLSSPHAPTPAIDSSATTSTSMPGLTLYGHICFLLARCPRVFKYLRDGIAPSTHHHADGDENGTSTPNASPYANKAGGVGKLFATSQPTSQPAPSAAATPPSKRHTPHQTPTRTPTAAASSSSSAYTPPPSARLAKSASMVVRSPAAGSHTARATTTTHHTAIQRQASTASLHTPNRPGSGVTSPIPNGTKSPHKSGVGSGAKSSRTVASSSPPTSPPHLLHAHSQPASLAASSSSPRKSPLVATRGTPTPSAPATPKLAPTNSPPTASLTPSALATSPIKRSTPTGSPASVGKKTKLSQVKSKLNTGRGSPVGVASTSTSSSRSLAAAVPSSTPPLARTSRTSSTSSNTGNATPATSEDGSHTHETSEAASDGKTSHTLLTAAYTDANTIVSTVVLEDNEVDGPAPSAADPLPSISLPPPSTSSIGVTDEKEPSHGTDSRSMPAHTPPPPPPSMHTLVLPLSSSKAMRAFFEYVYTDSITHAAVGNRPNAPSTDPHHDNHSNDTASSTSSTPMGVLDLLELGCLASSLHDARLLCLVALHMQRALNTSTVLTLLQALDRIGVLKNQQQQKRRNMVLSVQLNGCLALDQSKGKEKVPSIDSNDPYSLPASYLSPDTPVTFLRSGLHLLGSEIPNSSDVVGGCNCLATDLEILSRMTLDYLALSWNDVFGGGAAHTPNATQQSANNNGGANMKLLHSLPFPTFQLVVNLRNTGGPSSNWTTSAATPTTGSGSTPAEQPYVFKSIEEKAIYSQAHINAALIAGGIQPSAHPNLFHHASISLGGTVTDHHELLTLLASPTIALPPCRLIKALRKMYESRSPRTCDVRLIIEEEEHSSSSNIKSANKIRATLWAHRVILACGSDFFRTYFERAQLFGGGQVSDDSMAAGEELPGPGVTTVRFTAASFTQASLECVLRYIYYNETRHIDFVSALYLINTRVTNYFGLRQYGVDATSHSPSASPNSPAPPASFASDLENSCIAVLHSSLSVASSPSLAGGVNGVSPLGGDCLSLIQSAYSYGDRSLFEKACAFLDWRHLNQLMQHAQEKKKQEEQTQKERRLRQLRRKNEKNRNAMHGVGKRSSLPLSPSHADGLSPSTGVLFDSSSSSSSDADAAAGDDDDPDDDDSCVAGDLTLEPNSAAQFEFIAAIIQEKARRL